MRLVLVSLSAAVAGGGVAGPRAGVRGDDRGVDGALQRGLRVGRLGAGVQPSPPLHGPGPGVSAGRR